MDTVYSARIVLVENTKPGPTLADERVVSFDTKEQFIEELRDFADDLEHDEIEFWPDDAA